MIPFHKFDASSNIAFPLSIPGGVFTGGGAYSFRLTVYPAGDPKNQTFTQIVLTANSRPTGGYVTSLPTVGSALVTQFLVSSPGWTAYAANLPLSYSFLYSQSAASNYLTLKTSNLTAFTTSTLPAGLSTENNLITLQAQAADIFFSNASAYSTVAVNLSSNTNVSQILMTGLSSAFLSSNADLAFQTINNVATTINLVDCTDSPVCASLRRDSCLLTPHTCGSCKTGFNGVIGDSNTMYHDASAPKIPGTSGNIGSLCTTASNCLFGQCSNNICVAPALLCRTSVSGTEYSRNGDCSYSDPSGNALNNCTIANVTCTARCTCDPGFGRNDCSLSDTDLSARESIRRFLCQGLVTAAGIQENSSSLLATLTASLLSSFLPNEVVSDSGKKSCADALSRISSLLRRGYLQGSEATALLVTQLISLYTIPRSTSFRRRPNTTTDYPVTKAVRGLVRGVQLGMASGEKLVSLVSPNIQVNVTSALVTGVGSSFLTTPATAAQAAYGSIQPKVTLGPDGLTGCTLPGGYVQMSVLQFCTNPYSNSSARGSPLLRFSVASPAIIMKTYSIESQAHTSSLTFKLPGKPAYYIALQFSTVQNFDFSASAANPIGLQSYDNFTLPACTSYNGLKYVPRKGCNISTYTNYKVTYSCFDITQLCPKTSVRRYLQEVEYESTGAMILDDDDGSDEKEIKDYISNKEEGGGYELSPLRIVHGGGRAADDAADDDAPIASVTASVVGVLLQPIIAELTHVLSNNPFTINLVVFSFCGSLAGFIIITLIVMLRLDYNEKLQKIYVTKEYGAVARKLLRQDIKNGGNGDLDAAFEAHMGKLDGEGRKNRSIINRMLALKPRSAGNMSTSVTAITRNLSLVSAKDKAEDEDIEDDDENGSSQCNENDIAPDSFNEEGDGGDNDDNIDNNANNDNKDPHQNVSAAIVTEFFNKFFPGRSIFKKDGNFLQIVLAYHDFFSMFAGTTLRQPRTIRFLKMVSIVLVAIFAGTVFFGIYFPSNSPCTSMTNKISCLREQSKVRSGASHCAWSKAHKNCSLAPPPNDPFFVIIASLSTAIVSAPLILILSSLLQVYASRWPGSRGFEDDMAEEKEEKKVEEEDDPEEGRQEEVKGEERDEEKEKMSGSLKRTLTVAELLRDDICASAFGEEIKKGISSGAAADGVSESERAQMAYADFCTPMEEAIMIMDRVHSSLSMDNNSDTVMPWDFYVTSHRGKEKHEKLKAIENHLGVYPNGDLVPMTFRQKIFFGSPILKLEESTKGIEGNR